MTRKVLIGFGVDVDAVAGWLARLLTPHEVLSHFGCITGSGPMEVKIRRWTSPVYVLICCFRLIHAHVW